MVSLAVVIGVDTCSSVEVVSSAVIVGVDSSVEVVSPAVVFDISVEGVSPVVVVGWPPAALTGNLRGSH